MIVQWSKYPRLAKEKKTQPIEKEPIEKTNTDIKRSKKAKRSSNHPSDDCHMEPYTTNNTTSNFFTNDFQESNTIIDLDVSSIFSHSSQDIEASVTDREDGTLKYFLLHQFDSLFNSDSFDSIHAKPSEGFLFRNFSKAISSQYLFNCLMEKFNSNPPLFLHKYFEHMINYSVSIITSQISHSILVNSFKYFTLYQMETFLSKVIKKHFTHIIKNQYGIIVLSHFIMSCITIDESILMSLMKVILRNFSSIITDENSSKIIHTLLNLNNPLIANIVIEAIGNNSLSIALSPNGVHITRTFINCLSLRGFIVDKLLANIHVILVHHNGPKVIELLLNLNTKAISLFIINSLLSNIAFVSNADFFLLLIEKSIMSLDTEAVAQIYKTVSNPLLTDFLIKNQIGIRIMNIANRILSKYTTK